MASFNRKVAARVAKDRDLPFDEALDNPADALDEASVEDQSPYASLAREGAPEPDIAPGSLNQTQTKNDPIADLESQQQLLNQSRSNTREANLASNLGSVFSNLASGKTNGNPDLYQNINRQNAAVGENAASDLTRRENVMKAIQAAKTKVDIANLGAGSREKIAAARLQEAKNYHDVLAAGKEQKSTAAQAKEDEKTGGTLLKSLDPNGARTGNFGKAGYQLMAADRADAILKQFPDGNVPKSQTQELATAAAALISGGSIQSQHQLNAIVPQSLWGDANALAGWLNNEPKGLQQQAFIKNLADSIKREREVAKQQVDDIRISRLGASAEFAKRNPDKFSRILKSSGLDPKKYDFETGEYNTGSSDVGASAGGFSADVLDYAKTHNITPEQAASIKAKRTGGGQ